MKELLDWLQTARHTMRKRVWVPTDHESGYQEIEHGAIPCWWIDQEIERVRKEIEAKERAVKKYGNRERKAWNSVKGNYD